jgi:predicted enzyme related to lactoylglutathione lyase
MDRSTHLDGDVDANVAGIVPTSRNVNSLDAALRLVRRLGGSVTSETRTAPGIGSWALVTDHEGNDLVLWEDAAAAT